jgi:hypothetical protein
LNTWEVDTILEGERRKDERERRKKEEGGRRKERDSLWTSSTS